jgi:hypothetical protein
MRLVEALLSPWLSGVRTLPGFMNRFASVTCPTARSCLRGVSIANTLAAVHLSLLKTLSHRSPPAPRQQAPHSATPAPHSRSVE